jgi:predicted phage terminase large subunit-like protein
MPKGPGKLHRPGGKSQTNTREHSTLKSWAARVMAAQKLRPALHHDFLLSELEFVDQGSLDRLLILMPPGSAKSTYASTLFPAWWFRTHPGTSVIAASHTASLAERFGRRVRDLVTEFSGTLGYTISREERAALRWGTSNGGEYFATGIRGPVTGRRADLVIIDDPVKSHAEADSRACRENAWEWFRSDLITRVKPGGRIIVIMTRWHEDDLGGRILSSGDSQWRCLRLPAIAGPNDPMGRAIGAPLWPEWEDAAHLERKRNSVGERAWAALYQQSPRPLAGNLFQVSKIEFLDHAPPDTRQNQVVRAWDLAATLSDGSGNPDWTVGVKLMRDGTGRFTVLDVTRLRGSPRQVEEALLRAAQADGKSVAIALPEDPGQAGKSQISYLTAQLAGYRVTSSRESGSKATRALPVASQIEAGNLAVVRAGWNGPFLEELGHFPFGEKDDQVDALSRAFSSLIGAGASPQRTSVPLFAR